MRIVIFGAGDYGRRYYKYVKNYQKENSIVAIIDNKAVGAMENYLFQKAPILCQLEYDKVVITNSRKAEIEEIKHQLFTLGVSEEKIMVLMDEEVLLKNIYLKINQYEEEVHPRVRWLKDFAQFASEQELAGNVAECGVFRGEFAFYINKFFPEKRLYLFDSFEGFGKSDIEIERKLKNEYFLGGQYNHVGMFSETSEELVLNKVPHPEQCIVRKGFFPKTAEGVEDKFCFVMLDMDLYQPMLAGLQFFYDKMVSGGVILLHDYFVKDLPGVKEAVENFEKETKQKLCKVTIGDFCSLAVIKL